MSYIHTRILMPFGGGGSASTVNTLMQANNGNQGNTETIAVGSTRRLLSGPNVNGHFSLQVFVDSAGGAGSAMTVWYSNVPNPSIANDNDWTQDTTIGSIVLDTTASKIVNVGNVDTEWVMLKATAVTSTANIRAFFRCEGDTHGVGVDA